jgi:hypothetical protein
MKRFDEWSQGYMKTENSNGENKPRSQNKKTFEATKKNLGFEWEIPNK